MCRECQEEGRDGCFVCGELRRVAESAMDAAELPPPVRHEPLVKTNAGISYAVSCTCGFQPSGTEPDTEVVMHIAATKMGPRVIKPDTVLRQGDRGRCQAANRQSIAEVGFGEFVFIVKAPSRPWMSDEKGDPWVWIYRVGHATTWRLRRSIFNCNPQYFASNFLYDKE